MLNVSVHAPGTPSRTKRCVLVSDAGRSNWGQLSWLHESRLCEGACGSGRRRKLVLKKQRRVCFTIRGDVMDM